MLKIDYTNDILDTSKNTERVYNLKNASGEIVEENIRIEDITEYSQEGSKFGANDINATNRAVNNINVYVGEDKKLHFVNGEGADSVLPFSSGIESSTFYQSGRVRLGATTSLTIPLKKGTNYVMSIAIQEYNYYPNYNNVYGTFSIAPTKTIIEYAPRGIVEGNGQGIKLSKYEVNNDTNLVISLQSAGGENDEVWARIDAFVLK